MKRFQVSIKTLMVVVLALALVAAVLRMLGPLIPGLLLVVLYPLASALSIAALVALVRWSGKTWALPPTLSSSAILYGSVAIGYLCGRWIYPWIDWRYTFGLIPALVAITLVVIEGRRASKLGGAGDISTTQWACYGLAGYAFALMLFDPFTFLRSGDIPVKILLLVPTLLAVGHLSRVRAWVGTAGAAIFLETCTAILTSNAHSFGYGIGYIRGWVS